MNEATKNLYGIGAEVNLLVFLYVKNIIYFVPFLSAAKETESEERPPTLFTWQFVFIYRISTISPFYNFQGVPNIARFNLVFTVRADEGSPTLCFFKITATFALLVEWFVGFRFVGSQQFLSTTVTMQNDRILHLAITPFKRFVAIGAKDYKG